MNKKTKRDRVFLTPGAKAYAPDRQAPVDEDESGSAAGCCEAADEGAEPATGLSCCESSPTDTTEAATSCCGPSPAEEGTSSCCQ